MPLPHSNSIKLKNKHSKIKCGERRARTRLTAKKRNAAETKNK